LLSACAANVATRVLPREDGTISAISVAREESIAASASVKEANRYCDKQDGTAVFLDEETLYQGIWRKQTGGVDRVVKNIPVIGDKLTSDEDYQVTTRFKCLPTE
jgi:hypothetical protein